MSTSRKHHGKKRRHKLSQAIKSKSTGGTSKRHRKHRRSQYRHNDVDHHYRVKKPRKQKKSRNRHDKTVYKPRPIIIINGTLNKNESIAKSETEIQRVERNTELDSEPFEKHIILSSHSKKDTEGLVSLKHNEAIYLDNNYDHLTRVDLIFGTPGEDGFEALVAFSRSEMSFDEDWSYRQNIKKPKAGTIGVMVKKYLGKPNHFIKPNVGLGLHYGLFSWDFDTAIVDPLGEEIENDSLWYVRSSVYASLDVHLHKNVNVSASIEHSYIDHHNRTREGFEDDLFETYSTTLLGLELKVIF
ncbi:MAG: hypothetical protein MJH11_05545 [Lentisphaeria bacterium]|nr:hypothetical protein [Lentisphaeria bacterium]